VGELRAARHLANRPNPRRRGLQPLIDLDVSAIGQFDAGQLQSDPLGIRSAARCNQQVAALQGFLVAILFDNNSYRLTWLASYARIQKDIDAFVVQEALKRFRHIVVFSMHQPVIAIDQRHFAAKTAHGLREFQSDIAGPDREKMSGYLIQFECFDMGEGLRIDKARNWFERGVCAGVDDHIGSSEFKYTSANSRARLSALPFGTTSATTPHSCTVRAASGCGFSRKASARPAPAR